MNKGPMQVQIIDDEIVMLLAVSRAYRDKAVDIIAANTVEQALGQMDSFNFNLFLLDLDMKSCCSFQLLQTITERFPTTPVILMTTADTQAAELIDKIKNIRPQNCWHILEKPFDYKKLVSFIDRALQVSAPDVSVSHRNDRFDWSEKRRCRRFSRFERMNLSRLINSDLAILKLPLLGTLIDISVSGLRVTTGQALVAGEVVHFDEKFMHQSGTVVWSRMQKDQIFKSGIRFA